MEKAPGRLLWATLTVALLPLVVSRASGLDDSSGETARAFSFGRHSGGEQKGVPSRERGFLRSKRL